MDVRRCDWVSSTMRLASIFNSWFWQALASRYTILYIDVRYDKQNYHYSLNFILPRAQMPFDLFQRCCADDTRWFRSRDDYIGRENAITKSYLQKRSDDVRLMRNFANYPCSVHLTVAQRKAYELNKVRMAAVLSLWQYDLLIIHLTVYITTAGKSRFNSRTGESCYNSQA